MESYTIQIHVVDGKRDGIKIYNRPDDWSGEIITFPKSLHKELNSLQFIQPNTSGVYVLWSKNHGKYELYIGKSDDIKQRIGEHVETKVFWTDALVMISNNNTLNSAHVNWIEHMLIRKVRELSDHDVHNSNQPKDPFLNLQDRNRAEVFLKKLEEMLPIIGLNIFDIAEHKEESSLYEIEKLDRKRSKVIDTVIVPTGKSGAGFEDVYLNGNCWYYIRMSEKKLEQIKYVAAYRPAPDSYVSHMAEVDRFELQDNGKYKVYFKSSAVELQKKIPFGTAKSGSLQGPRYVNREELMSCSDLGLLL